MQKGSSCYKFQCLFLMLLFYFLAEGPAVAPCTKDYCTSSWTWSIYSCNNIYSSNRGSPIIKFLSLYSQMIFIFLNWLFWDTFLFLKTHLKYCVGLYSPEACFSRSVACPTKCNCMSTLNCFSDVLLLQVLILYSK